MHARWASLQVKPGRIDDFIGIFRDSMVPPARAQKGFKGVFLLTDRDTGKVVGASLWETEADARAVEMSSGSFGSQADKVRGIVTEMPVMEYYDVMARETPLERGGATHARVNHRQIPPDKMDEAISTYQNSVMPVVNAFRGCVGTVVLTDRSTGKLVAISLWGSEADMMAIQPPGDVDAIAGGPPVRETYEVSLQE